MALRRSFSGRLLPRHGHDVGAQLVNSHLRAMQLDSHLIDVVSTDHHTVKPWFAGKVDFAPPVKQLDAEGYVLKGGRIDVVDARTAAVLVYQAGGTRLRSSFGLRARESATTFHAAAAQRLQPAPLEENGFEVWCVSDMAAEELDKFARRWTRQASLNRAALELERPRTRPRAHPEAAASSSTTNASRALPDTSPSYPLPTSTARISRFEDSIPPPSHNPASR